MSEPFIGEIKQVGFNFAPRGWALCDGQLLPISQYSALFSLLGTTFGGDGRTTFALPDLRGRVSVHVGRGPGLSDYRWGQKGGAETTTLTAAQMPSHSHHVRATNTSGAETTPQPDSFLAEGNDSLYTTDTPDVNMGTTTNTGGGQSFDQRQPYLGIYHVIALQGIFPSRS